MLAFEEPVLRSAARELPARLRVKGFGLCLDDFDGGELPQGVPLNAVRLAVLDERPLDAARAAGLRVLATGCATAADFDRALELGCAMAQGPFVGAAVPASELSSWTPPTASP